MLGGLLKEICVEVLSTSNVQVSTLMVCSMFTFSPVVSTNVNELSEIVALVSILLADLIIDF